MSNQMSMPIFYLKLLRQLSNCFAITVVMYLSLWVITYQWIRKRLNCYTGNLSNCTSGRKLRIRGTLYIIWPELSIHKYQKQLGHWKDSDITVLWSWNIRKIHVKVEDSSQDLWAWARKSFADVLQNRCSSKFSILTGKHLCLKWRPASLLSLLFNRTPPVAASVTKLDYKRCI